MTHPDAPSPDLDPKGLEAAIIPIRFHHHRWTPITAEQAFDLNVMPEPNSGCWIWTGRTYFVRNTETNERPVFSFKGKRRYAYQVSYERYVGPIPEGLMICHACNVSVCVNPDHLYAGTAKDNAADALKAGTHTSILWAAQKAERNAR